MSVDSPAPSWRCSTGWHLYDDCRADTCEVWSDMACQVAPGCDRSATHVETSGGHVIPACDNHPRRVRR